MKMRVQLVPSDHPTTPAKWAVMEGEAVLFGPDTLRACWAFIEREELKAAPVAGRA